MISFKYIDFGAQNLTKFDPGSEKSHNRTNQITVFPKIFTPFNNVPLE
jgi:hypothetical protein